jgi:hypothetical protein
MLKWPTIKVVKRYNATTGELKRFGMATQYRHRQWVFSLNRDGRRPQGWQKHTLWIDYRSTWLRTIALADKFVESEVKNESD